MRDYTGVSPETLPSPEATDFKSRLRDMLNRFDYYLLDQSKGMARIQLGQVPDGSGEPIGGNGELEDYFFLPGRSGGQKAYFDTADGGGGFLSSTSAGTKGFIFFGDGLLSMYDEENVRFGLNVTPAAEFHIKANNAGTTTLLPANDIVQTMTAYTGVAGTPTGNAAYDALDNDDDYTLYLGNTATQGTTKCGLNGTIPNTLTSVTINYKSAWLSAPVLDSSVYYFAIVNEDGEMWQSANIPDETTVPVSPTVFGSYSVTIDMSGPPISTGNTPNAIWVQGPNKTAYWLVSYTSIVFVPEDIVRISDSGDTVRYRVDPDLHFGIGTSTDTLTSLVTLQSNASDSDEPLLTLLPDATQTDNVMEVWNFNDTHKDFNIGPGGLVTISDFTATDNDVRFQVRAPITQTTAKNIMQVVRSYNVAGTDLYSAFTVGGTGALVIGDALTFGAGVIRLRINQGSGQSVDMFQIRNTADTISLASVDSVARWDIRPVGSGTTTPSLAIRRTTAAAAPIQEWQNTSGTPLSRIVANGSLVVRVDNAGLNVTGSLSTSFTSVGAAALTTIQTNTTGWSGSFVTNGLWRLEPTLSDPGGVGGPGVLDTTMFRINADIDDAAGSMIGLQSIVDISDDSGFSAGACTAIGLDFNANSSGTGAIGNLVGVQGTTLHDSSGTASNLIGGNFIVRSSGGNVTNIYALKPDCLIDSGTITNHYSLYVGLPSISGTGAVTTAYGVYIENKAMTGFTTKWALYAAGGDSSLAGNTTLGSNDTPTAKAHLAAGTTAASTAPLKFTSGSLMSAVEAGAEEYDGSYHYLTNSTTRGAIATTGNVVVDLGGDVVTTLDGEVLLAA